MTTQNEIIRREWFLDLIRDAGYTQSAFAETSNISRQTLEKIISGNGLPSKKVSKKIESVIGIPNAWWENPPENPLTELIPTEHNISAQRHINCIGEVAIPAAFRRALNWEFGIDVTVKLDKANQRLIVEKA
ncbi:MAG: helix-turn-helix domain-containing protein [Oscillospiraceae bacterium]|nr:helix-turn-helix domain-containing protein [Oscillospiraceae bacterium]